MSKQLLIENGFITNLKISNELKESISLANGKGDTLVVRNVPCTILNRKNQNGRIYSTRELQKAITKASEAIKTKQLLSQADEHPEGSFVAPTHASHVVTNVYIKPNVEVVVEGQKGRFDMLFMDWEVLDTDEGRNLKALLKAECSLGTSIRGLGDMQGDQVVDYELLGVDVVSNPSSGTFTRMPVKESITLEVKKANEMKEDVMQEAYTVEAETNDTVANTDIASQLLSKLDSPEAVGTLAKASVKFDTEVDPDTGTETNLTILTTNTADDVNDIQQALELAGKKLASNIGTTDSVTISRIEDEDLEKESIEEAVTKFVLRSEEDGQVVYYVGDTEIPTTDINNAAQFDTYDNADNIRVAIADNMWPNANWTIEEVPMQESEVSQEDNSVTVTDDNGNTYTNTFDTEEQAQAAAAAANSDNGDIEIKKEDTLEETLLGLSPNVIDNLMALAADTLVPGAGTIYIASQGVGIDPAKALKQNDTTSVKSDDEDKESDKKKDDEEEKEESIKNEETLNEDDMLDSPFSTGSDMSNDASEKTYGYALKVLAGDAKDWYVKSQTTPVEVGPELRDAVVFNTSDEAVEFQANNNLNNYQYEDGTFSPIEVVEISVTESVVARNEKLYTQPSTPSDEYVKEPLEDAAIEEAEPVKYPYEITLSDIDYDVNVDDWSEEELQQIVDQAQDVIHTTENLTDQEANDHNYLIGLMIIKTGLPIKDGKIEVKKEVASEKAEAAGDYNPIDQVHYENDNPEDKVSSTVVKLIDKEAAANYIKLWKEQGLQVIPVDDMTFKVIGNSELIQGIDEYFNTIARGDEFDPETRNYI